MKNPLDTLLQDPRCHRAVADPEMSERVTARVLRRHAARASERAASTGATARPARTRWFRPAPAATRWALAGTGAAALALAAVLIAARLGWIRRVDLLAKHWLADLGDALRTGLLFAPLTTALFLAGVACLAGFAALPGARRGWRLAFGG